MVENEKRRQFAMAWLQGFSLFPFVYVYKLQIGLLARTSKPIKALRTFPYLLLRSNINPLTPDVH